MAGQIDRSQPLTRSVIVAVLATAPFFFAFLFSMASIATGNADTNDLGRTPTPWPEDFSLNYEGRLEVTEFLRDRVWKRRAIRRSNAQLSERLRDGSPKEVLRGTDGWHFFSRSLDQALKRTFRPEDPARSMATVSELVTSSGREFRMLVAPNKASIYHRYLSLWAKQQQLEASERVGEMRRLLHQRVPGYLDLWTPLQSLSESSEPLLYFERDTHWNSLGAAVAAELVVESLGLDWDESALQPRGSILREADLNRLLGLGDLIEETQYGVRRPGIRTSRTVADGGWIRYETVGDGGPLLPNLVVIHDSFGDALFPLLPPYFVSSTFVPFWTEPNEVLVEVLRTAELVVLIQVERDFVNRKPSESTGVRSDLGGILRVFSEFPLVANDDREAETQSVTRE